MKPYWSNDAGTLYQGDVFDVLAGLPKGFAHMCVTSPPYWGLRDYGVDGQMGLEKTPKEWVDKMVAVGSGLWRVLRDDATWWCNVGDSYTTRFYSHDSLRSVAVQDGDWSRTGQRDAHGTYQPPVAFDGLKPKDLCLMPFRLALALQDAGWYVRSDICFAKKAPMPESVTDRPTSAWEHIFLLSKSKTYFYDAEAVREPWADGRNGRAGGQSQHYESGRPDGQTKRPTEAPKVTGANLRNWWLLGSEPYPEAHFATFPSEIPRRAIKAGTSEKGVCSECGAPWNRVVERTPMVIARSGRSEQMGEFGRTQSSGTMVEPPTSTTTGWQPSCECDADVVPATVIDPFAGSCTTNMVAQQLGRRHIGIELNPEYLDLGIRRINNEAAQRDLFRGKSIAI